MMNQGYVRLDEVMYPVVGIELAASGVVLHARATGPLPAASGPIRVFTARGEAVTEWATDEFFLNMAEVPVGSVAIVKVNLHFRPLADRPS